MSQEVNLFLTYHKQIELWMEREETIEWQCGCEMWVWPRLQERGNSDKNWERCDFSKKTLRTVTGATGRTEVLVILLAHHSHQPLNLMHLLSLNIEIGSRFMILFDPLSTQLNALPFIFSPPLLYKLSSPPF